MALMFSRIAAIACLNLVGVRQRLCCWGSRGLLRQGQRPPAPVSRPTSRWHLIERGAWPLSFHPPSCSFCSFLQHPACQGAKRLQRSPVELLPGWRQAWHVRRGLVGHVPI